MAAPMPRLPPVTSATRPMSVPLLDVLGFDRYAGAAESARMLRPRPSLALRALHAHGHAHAAADAEGGEAALCAAALHLEQERVEHPAAGGADRVADGDGAAVHVHLRRIPAHILVDGAGLGGERLVCLDQIEILGLPAGLFQRLAGG